MLTFNPEDSSYNVKLDGKSYTILGLELRMRQRNLEESLARYTKNGYTDLAKYTKEDLDEITELLITIGWDTPKEEED